MPHPCYKLIATSIGGTEPIFGLSLNQKLCSLKKLIHSECTSFTVYKNFLIFTCLSQQLFQAMHMVELDSE